MSTNAAVGEKVRALRKAVRLTQDALAARIPDISLDYYRQLEQGNRRWNIDTLDAVAVALNVDICALLPGSRANNAPGEERLLTAVRAKDWPRAMLVLGELATQPDDKEAER